MLGVVATVIIAIGVIGGVGTCMALSAMMKQSDDSY
jgi:hypothetical protein